MSTQHDAARLVVELTEALHGAGAPAHRLEATVGAVGRVLGISTAVFAQPTAVFLELDGHTRLLRVEPREVDLATLVAVDRIAADLRQGLASVPQARVRLQAVAAAPRLYGRAASAAAWTGAAGAAAVFFGGGAAELALSALLSGLASLLPSRLGNLGTLVAAVAAGVLAHLAAGVLPLRTEQVVLASLIVFLPGFTLTVGLTELAARNLAAGTARLSAAAITLLQLGVGIGLASALSAHLPPALPSPASIAVPALAQVLAVVAAAISFLVLFRARWVDLPAVLAVAFVAVHGTRLGGLLLGADAAPFLGALAVGLVSNLHGRLRDLPSMVLLVPGIILLVPGSLGFRGMAALVEGGEGLLDGARMFLVGASLVAGVLAANAILPPRREL